MSDPVRYAKPSFFMRVVIGPIMVRSGMVPVLTVTGRTSGQSRRVPLGSPIVVDGRRYLISARGQTQWIRNLRAVGCGELRIHGKTESFRAVEATGAELDRVIEEYKRDGGKYIARAFEKMPNPADHPAFRLDADAPETGVELVSN